MLPPFTPSQSIQHTCMRSGVPGSDCPTLALACAVKEFQCTYTCKGGERERERERDSKKKRERDRDRQKKRDSEKETERQRQREKERQ